ncbi:esterase E4-like isoform X2 [Photinus pyralis]|uniref:esterase E4-like isoform X2 n=1 Tax=Photinus pyralis TaxID=7054 RepID=UPI0012674CF7|nr:esterase E4-like isoform X2 [Photinus pyralis]
MNFKRQKMWTLLVLLVQVGFILCKSSESSGSSSSEEDHISIPPPHVTTQHGTIKGLADKTYKGETFYSFKGIRYVEAPVGDLRFKAPVPVKPWTGVYDASYDRPACPQPASFPTDEDCLFLNVHTRKLPKRGKNPKYPVILYIHPGSFTTRSGNTAMVGPHYLLERKVVLVTINYRLSALGFLSTGDELSPGNYGMKDQVEAMRWIKENIAAFGGDPDCVTLAGYSVGGVSAALHLTSPMSRGLFHRVMIMSGSAFGNGIMPRDQLDLAKRQARIVGCPDDNNGDMMKCLKNASAEALGNSLEQFRVFGTDPQFFWQFVLEPDYGQERFLIEHPLISIQKGDIADVPIMTGVTHDELLFLAYPTVTNETALEVFNRDANKIFPYSFYYERGSDAITAELQKFYFNNKPVSSNSLEPLGQLYADALAGFAVNRGAQLLSKVLKNKVYYYIFTYKGSYSHFTPESGAKYVVHFDDQLYVFWNSLSFPKFTKRDPDATMVKKLTTLYANFAYYGNPTPKESKKLDQVIWTPFTEQNKLYLDVGDRLTMKSDIFPERYAKWRELFPLPSANDRTAVA